VLCFMRPHPVHAVLSAIHVISLDPDSLYISDEDEYMTCDTLC
jgi:hypothetical protein